MDNLSQNSTNNNEKLEKENNSNNYSALEFDISLDACNHPHNEIKQYSNQNIEGFYDIIKMQSNEVKSLMIQRESFLNLIQKFDDLNSINEKTIESLNHYLVKLDQENSNLKNKLSEVENRYQKNNQDFNDLYNLLLRKAPLEILQKVNIEKHPKERSSECENITGNLKEVVALFEELCSQYSSFKNVSSREIVLLGHLKNALDFISIFIDSHALQNTDIEKNLVMSQIERIKQYINQNYGNEDIQPVVNLFQQNNSKDQIDTIYAFLNKNANDIDDDNKDSQVNNSSSIPFNELYALFLCVIEMNNLLFSQNDKISPNLLQKVNELEEANNKLAKFSNTFDSKSKGVSSIAEASNEQNCDTLDSQHFAKEPNNSKKLVKPNANMNFQSDSSLIDNNSSQNSNFSNNKKKNNQNTIRMLILQNQQNVDKVNYLKAMVQRLKKEIASEKKKFLDFENSSNSQIDKLKSELRKKDKISSQLSKLMKQNKKLLDNVNELTNRNIQIQADLENKNMNDSPFQEEESHKQKNDESEIIENLNSDVQTQADDQASNDIILKLQKQISSLENECSESRLKLLSLSNSKNDLLSQNAQLKVSERMLKLKISQMEEFIAYKDDQIKTQARVRNITIESQSNLKIQELTEQLKNHEFLLKNFVETYFKSIQISKETKYPEIFSMLEQEMMNMNLFYSQETLNDASKIRKELNLKKSDSLYDAFHQIKTNLDKQIEIVQKLDKEK